MAHEDAFPFGTYLISEVGPVSDFDKSTKDNKVQQIDKDTGLPLWSVDVLDADPEARRGSKTVTVKIPAKVQPVPPANNGSAPFTAVVFEGLSVLPWIEESGSFSKISWSFRAEGIAEPTKQAGKSAGGTSAAGDKAVA
jgi:hypothetical protein